MLHVLVNHNFTPDWLKDKDYLIFDRSDSKEYLKDFDQSRIVYTENVGNVDFDKLMYLYDHYFDLPEVFVWGKTNLFKYITEEEYDKLKDNQFFTPLLTQHHKTYPDSKGVVCYYENGMYYERNDNWYVHQFNYHYFKTYEEFVKHFDLPNPAYIPFAPGGNYILTKDAVYKRGRDFYGEMASVMNHSVLPVEAHFAERCYYNLFK